MKIDFIFLSKDDQFLMEDNDFDQARKEFKGIHRICTDFIPNNKVEIARVYNNRIGESLNPNTKECDYDHLVFLHSDVKFDPTSFISHLAEIEGKYDLIGLAGAKRIRYSATPLNWFVGSFDHPESRYGDVTMLHDDGREIRCFYNKDFKDVRDTSVSCVDGLCLILSKGLVERGFRFDEGISDFDFYDTGASFKTIFGFNSKVGVMVEPVFHKSVGKGILGQDFLDSEARFRRKWDELLIR